MRGIFSTSKPEFKSSDLGDRGISDERLDEIVASIVELVGCPAVEGRRVSRDEVGISPLEYIHLDVGSGFGTFTTVINIDQRKCGTFKYLGKTPRFICIADWAGKPCLPFRDDFADKITLLASHICLNEHEICEIARCVRPEGIIEFSMLHPEQEVFFQKLAAMWRVDLEEVTAEKGGMSKAIPDTNANYTESFHRIRVPSRKLAVEAHDFIGERKLFIYSG